MHLWCVCWKSDSERIIPTRFSRLARATTTRRQGTAAAVCVLRGSLRRRRLTHPCVATHWSTPKRRWIGSLPPKRDHPTTASSWSTQTLLRADPLCPLLVATSSYCARESTPSVIVTPRAFATTW